MWHIMLDVYGARDTKMNDLKEIYESLFKITNALNLSTIMPPILVPYYYGNVKEDDGISAFVMLSGGHFTIHTFPQRECYFVDIVYDGFINEDKFTEVLYQELPFSKKNIFHLDRRYKIEEQATFHSIDERIDFGPHYLLKVENINLTMESIYHILDELPTQINMDPILRPIVITNKINQFSYYSGITVIAQSHIAMHYQIKTQILYMDIFSCSFINCEDLIQLVENKLGKKIEHVLISRGSKHAYKLANREEVISRYNIWKKNIL